MHYLGVHLLWSAEVSLHDWPRRLVVPVKTAALLYDDQIQHLDDHYLSKGLKERSDSSDLTSYGLCCCAAAQESTAGQETHL